VASLEPQYRLPPGVEISKDVFVVPTPPWLLLPSWTVLVGMSDPFDFAVVVDESKAQLKFESWRDQPAIAANEVVIATVQPLPQHTVVVQCPNKTSVYAWRSAAPGLKAAEEHRDIWLPDGHYLIERPSKNTTLPPCFESGYSPIYAGAKGWYKFSPGIEVIHIVPSFHLPLGISVQSSLALKKTFVLSETDKYPPALERLASMCNLWSIIQFCPGQTLSPGCTILPFPPSFLTYGNPLYTRLINSLPANPTSNRIFDNKSLLLFVCLNTSAPGYCFPPEGCYEFVDATKTLVSEHFPFLLPF